MVLKYIARFEILIVSIKRREAYRTYGAGIVACAMCFVSWGGMSRLWANDYKYASPVPGDAPHEEFYTSRYRIVCMRSPAREPR